MVRQIRRRGKNKIAARNCRARQSAHLSALESETQALERRLREQQQVQATLRQELAREQRLLQQVL